MKTSLKRIAMLIFASALTIALNTSCGTIHGIGHDVEAVGHNIGQAAN